MNATKRSCNDNGKTNGTIPQFGSPQNPRESRGDRQSGRAGRICRADEFKRTAPASNGNSSRSIEHTCISVYSCCKLLRKHLSQTNEQDWGWFGAQRQEMENGEAGNLTVSAGGPRDSKAAESENDHCQAFQGCVVCVTGLSKSERQEVANTVQAGGGRYETTTHSYVKPLPANRKSANTEKYLELKVD
jgi:hypothetical protein